jgi:two-component system nitrate/nitrite response regulator NarL
MAKRLSIRSNTVRTHVQSVLTKLRVHTRLGAATLAMRQGLLNPDGLP